MALDFNANGVADYGDNANYDGFGHVMSVSLMLNLDGETGSQHFVAKWETTFAWLVGMGNNAAGYIEFVVGTSDGGSTCFYSGSLNGLGVAVETWVHLVFTYDGAQSDNNRMKCYVNGVASGSFGDVVDADIDIPGVTTPLLIGGRSDRRMDGKLCDVAVWNRVVSATQAAWLYNSGDHRSALYDTVVDGSAINSGLVFYDRLTTKATSEDEIQNVTPSFTNGADYTHPTMNYPVSFAKRILLV